MIKATGIAALVAGAGLALLVATPSLAGGMAEPTEDPEIVVDPAPVGEDDGMVYAGGDPNFDESGGGQVVDGDDSPPDEVVEDDSGDWDDGEDWDEGDDEVIVVVGPEDPDVIYYMTGDLGQAPEGVGAGAVETRKLLLPQARTARAEGPSAEFCRQAYAQGQRGDCGWIFSQATRSN